jgi:hypothetical protein
MNRPLIAAAGLVLVATGCGSDGSTPTARDTAPPEPTSYTVTVHTDQRPGRHGEMYFEGALPEIRLVSADGTLLEPAKDHQDTAVFADLEPGDYTIRAAQRPCDGNCGYLDGPMDACEHQLTVTADTTVEVDFRVAEPCTVST